MEFFTRVLSGNSRLLKERVREAEQLNQTFRANLDNFKRLLESEESEDVLALLDMVYDSSFPEEQVFMKTPTRARLKSKKEVVVRLLIGLDSLGVPVMAEMLAFIRKHGPEEVLADSVMTLLELLSPLLEGKEAPDFSTDDVMDAMDFEWHSTSRVGSPLLNVMASATSSPARASAASIGDSPLHPMISASPYRRAISDRSMLVSRAHELGAKFVLDKPSTASMPPRPSLTMSASSQYPSVNQDFRFGEPTILEAPASPEIIQDSTNEKPSSYSLDTLPASSQLGLQRKHRRKSSSLQQLFEEDANDELSREGSVGASTKRYSSSSSRRRNSFEMITNTSETSSPMNPGLDAGDSREGASVALDKEFLSSINTQDRHVNRSSRKGSHRISPSPPPDEMDLWREDSGGFSVDLVPSNKSAAPTLDNPNPTERHADGVEAASICEDLIKSSKSNIFEQEKDILPAFDSSSLSNNDFRESLNIVSQTAQSTNSDVVPGNELSKAEEDTEKLISDKEEPSTEKPLETQEVSYMKQNQIEESGQNANWYYGDGKLEAIDSATNDDLLTPQRKFSEDESIKSEDVNVDSISAKEHEMKVEHIDGYGAKVEGVNTHSISDNDNDMNVGHEFIEMEDANACSSFHGSGIRSNEHTYSSSDSDERDSSSSQICIASKSSTVAQEHKADYNRLPEDQLNKNAIEAALDKLLQTKQSNVLQHGHQRSHSDLTPVRSLFKAESTLTQEKFNPQHGSESASRTEKLRRKFARRLRSLTASMESLKSRGSSSDRLESMPWMRMKMENNQQRQEAREGHENGSFSDASSDKSGSSVDDAGRDKAPHEDGRRSVLQNSEASVHAVDGDDALKPFEHELGLQSYSNGDVQLEDARLAHSSQDHKEVAGPALSSSNNSYQDAGHVDTHEELHGDHNIQSSQEDAGRGCAPSSIDDYYQDAGHAHSLDTLEEDAGHAVTHVPYASDEDNNLLSSHDSDEDAGRGLIREEVAVHAHTHEEDARHTCSSGACDQDAGHTCMADHEQDGCETTSDKITPKEQGYGFQWILAPLLLPSSSNVSQGVDDQAGDIAPLSLENDKDINSLEGSSGDKKEDRELHAGLSPCEEIQSSQEADDVKPSCPLQDQWQVEIHHGSHTDVPVQSSAMNITDDTHLPFTQSVHEIINEDGDHLLSVSSNDADVPPTNGITVTGNNELSGDQHPLLHVKTDEHLQELPSLDALNRSTTWADYADSNSTLEAPAFLESSPMHGEVCLEEILQRKDDQSSMQEALEMKDDNSPAEEHNEHKSSLVEGGNSSLATDSFNHLSLIENIKVEMPELIREDEKKENLQPLDVHVDNVSGPNAVGAEHLKVSDGQFDKLLSELDAADGGVFCESGELPLIGDTERGQMGMHPDKMGEKTQEEEFSRGLDKEKMQLHGEQMGIVDEKKLSKENSEGEFLDNTGQFILGGPRHIPALVEDHDQASPNVQPSFEHEMRQDTKGVHEADSDNISACESTTFMHLNLVESRDVASRDQQYYGGSKEASMVYEQENFKLDQDKQYGLEYPTMEEEAVQEEEATNPCWEVSEVMDASGTHPLNDPQSSPQISGPAGAQSTDTESTAPFTDSGTECRQSLQVVDANESQPLRRDIQRSAVHFTEREPYAGSFMVDNAADGDMHAGLMDSLEDHEYQQPKYTLSHVIPLSNKTDPPAADNAHLHGHPTSSSALSHVESQQESGQHVLNQPATSSDPTMARWDMDTNVPRSKRKGGWARGCLSCCTKPHTNS